MLGATGKYHTRKNIQNEKCRFFAGGSVNSCFGKEGLTWNLRKINIFAISAFLAYHDSIAKKQQRGGSVEWFFENRMLIFKKLMQTSKSLSSGTMSLTTEKRQYRRNFMAHSAKIFLDIRMPNLKKRTNERCASNIKMSLIDTFLEHIGQTYFAEINLYCRIK